VSLAAGLGYDVPAAARLEPDALDRALPTSVQEANRAAEMARTLAGHAMGHGVYRQRDAGRDDVPITSPPAHLRQNSAPSTSPAGGGHEGHSMDAPAAPATSVDPHAGHQMAPQPTPSPSPSPSPKVNP
jgi:hypothetical protein